MIHGWIGEGCRPDPDGAARCVRTEVFPRDRVVKSPATSQQLRVVAHFSDGSSRDITHLAVYSSSNEGLATVDRRGLVTGAGTGQAGILIRVLDKMQAARVTLIENRPGFVWPNPLSVNKVDQLVHGRLQVLQVPPSPASSDGQFLRRVSLDLTGLLPTVASTRAFLSDKRPEKRGRLIDDEGGRTRHPQLRGNAAPRRERGPVRHWLERTASVGVDRYQHWFRLGLDARGVIPGLRRPVPDPILEPRRPRHRSKWIFNLWQKVKTQGVEKVKTQGVEKVKTQGVDKVPPNLWQNVRQRLHPFRPMRRGPGPTPFLLSGELLGQAVDSHPRPS